MSKRSDALREVEEHKHLFSILIGKRVCITFDTHSFTTILSDVALARFDDLENKPKPRKGEEKNYRPPVMTITTHDGKLHFIVEDITLSGIANGVVLSTNKTDVKIQEA